MSKTHKHKWKEVVDGTTIHGKHLHVYECKTCLLLDYSVEEGDCDGNN